MRLDPSHLDAFKRTVAPPPPPIEPRLTVAEEVALLCGKAIPDASIARRRARVIQLLRRAATPTGEDADLIASLAAAKALPLEHRRDEISAHQRLVAIGSSREPSQIVGDLAGQLGVEPGDGLAFANALLPPHSDVDPGWQGTLYPQS